MNKAAKIIPLNVTKIPENRIFFRLKTNPNEITTEEKARIVEIMRKAFSYCKFVACFREIEITVGSDGVTLADGTFWQSTKLAENLSGCSRAVISGVTIGDALPKAGAELFANGNSAHGVIYDATGSEAVEAAADSLQTFLKQQYARTGGVVNRHRFSAGYGSWELTAQQDFFRLLPMNSLGVTLTENLFMTPEKSITAIVGIKDGGSQ